jgi:hypothetical protein
MLLIRIFVELCVIAGRCRTHADRPHTISGRPMLIHTCHSMPMPRCAVDLRNRFQNGIVVAWHGRGVVCVNQTRLHSANQMGKTQSKTLAARHGRETVRARHGHSMGTALDVWISLKKESLLLHVGWKTLRVQLLAHSTSRRWTEEF